VAWMRGARRFCDEGIVDTMSRSEIAVQRSRQAAIRRLAAKVCEKCGLDSGICTPFAHGGIMVEEKKGEEPQSYGSEKDWVAGKTAQKVNESQKKPAPSSEFYDSVTGSEVAAIADHGSRSPVDRAEDAALRSDTTKTNSVVKDTGDESGHRDSYFKDRDYSGR
ncbi:MAG TPA: hypothetical protein VNM92_18625, partial [Thermoanaerobaculia bacterium]|nr:hypothetical protein [Thermoanaerobaculia bacterium]